MPIDIGGSMCEHEYEVEGELLEVHFDENDYPEVVAKPVWMCYDCQEVVNTQDEVYSVTAD